ncbi:Ig-like domain-containing protein, partial [Myxococcota bacterium]
DGRTRPTGLGWDIGADETGCSLDTDCPLCQWCNAGSCENQNAGIDGKNECPAGECVTGTCNGSGACGAVAAGTSCTDDGQFCTGAEQCNGAGGCGSIGDPCPGSECNTCNEATDTCFDAAGTSCTDDSLFCTGTEACDGAGSCVGGGDPCPGSECNTCNEAGDTCFDTAGTPCTDDGAFCTGTEECNGAGVCGSTGDPCPGTECNTCNEGASNCFSAAGTGCADDGLFCTGPEECDGAGMCAGTGDPCPGTECNTCNEGPDTCFDAPGTSCTDDGLFCTGAEECDGSGACVGGGDPCPGSECNSCNEAANDCFDALGTACGSDGQFCTGPEECDGAGTCASLGNPCAVPADCDDTNDICGACGDGVVGGTEDCDPGAPRNDYCCDPGSCVWTTTGSVDPQGVCSGAPECQTDVCNGNGMCTTANDVGGTPCTNDSLFCTGTEECLAGVCSSTGDPCPGSECNTCNEGARTCFTSSGTACTDDGLFCTGPEECDGAGTCAGSGDPCSALECNTCNEGSDTCFTAAGSGCTSDGLFCTGPEQCDGAGTCASIGDPCPGTECNSCSEALDSCFEAAGTVCTSDGLFCTGPEECDGAGSCAGAGDPCLNTECNTCNETADTCHTVAGTSCTDDGLFCTGAEGCDGLGACAGVGDPCVAPLTCSEADDACVSPAAYVQVDSDGLGDTCQAELLVVTVRDHLGQVTPQSIEVTLTATGAGVLSIDGDLGSVTGSGSVSVTGNTSAVGQAFVYLTSDTSETVVVEVTSSELAVDASHRGTEVAYDLRVSRDLSTMTVDPATILADGLDESVVEVIPRDSCNELLGPGHTIELIVPDMVALAGVTDAGDGRYTDIARVTTCLAGGSVQIMGVVDSTSAVSPATLHVECPDTMVLLGHESGKERLKRGEMVVLWATLESRVGVPLSNIVVSSELSPELSYVEGSATLRYSDVGRASPCAVDAEALVEPGSPFNRVLFPICELPAYSESVAQEDRKLFLYFSVVRSQLATPEELSSEVVVLSRESGEEISSRVRLELIPAERGSPDSGCGCNTSSAGCMGLGVILLGLAARLLRQRRR